MRKHAIAIRWHILHAPASTAWQTHDPNCYVPVYGELRGVRIGPTGGLNAKITSENATGGSPCWIGTIIVHELSLRAAASTFASIRRFKNRELADMVPSSGCVTEFGIRSNSVLDLMN